MIIMQTENAEKRREYILKNDLAKVITYSAGRDHTLVQYHPKGIKGPDRLFNRFSRANKSHVRRRDA
jgi:hypothetical protein